MLELSILVLSDELLDLMSLSELTSREIEKLVLKVYYSSIYIGSTEKSATASYFSSPRGLALDWMCWIMPIFSNIGKDRLQPHVLWHPSAIRLTLRKGLCGFSRDAFSMML